MGAKGEQIKGQVKETIGGITGDKDLEAEGKLDRHAGEVKEKVGDAKDKVEELIDKAKDALDRK